MSPLRLGLVGAGFIAKMYLRALKEDALADVRLIADPDADAIAACGAPCVVVPTDEILRDPRVDCICVLSPHALHADQIRAALAAGKHVITEKPLALSVADAEELVQLASSRERHLVVRHYLREAPFTAFLRAALANGELGATRSVALEWATNQVADVPARGRWRGTWDAGGGGVLMDIGIHAIDVLRELFGVRAVEASALARTTGTGDNAADDVAVVIARVAGGGIARVFVTSADTTTRAPRWRWEVLGERERIEVGGDWSAAVLRRSGRRPPAEQVWHDWWELTSRASVRAAVRTVAREEPSPESARSSVATLRLVLAAYEAAGITGRVDHAREWPAST